MEQWRLLLAIVLSIFVFFLWEMFFVGPEQVAPPVKEKKEQASETGRQAEAPAPSGGEAVEEPPGEEASMPAEAEAAKDFKTVRVKSSLYTAEISEKGAAFTSFVLHKYREGVDPGSDPKELVSGGEASGTAVVKLGQGDPENFAGSRFTTDFEGRELEIRESGKSISFFCKSASGLVIEKKYTFIPGSYKIGLEVVVKNFSGSSIDRDLLIGMRNALPEDPSRFAFEGPFAFLDGELVEIDIDDIEEKHEYSGSVEWAGLCDRYFMTAVIPESEGSSKFRLSHDPGTRRVSVSYFQPVQGIKPNMQEAFSFSLFMGPKQMSVLREYGNSLGAAVDFGFFDIIAKPCLWMMNFLYNHFVPNYGVAIILLTILFKIIFWPLGTKSYKSMAEMKKLQPLMAEIRKKYKDDKKKMNEEVMKLYRTYKVNPMSGCLPMVVQIPVFIAFYRMLYEAIELRHAPFILWINDLSSPDRLFRFDVSIPLMLPPYGIPVLTLIMGATMFLQQKLSPPPGDPSQAKFMMFMPLIFTVIFVNFPSGLVLYWLVNNVISIAQQYFITKKYV